MPITTRLTSAGTYYVNGVFDETSWTPADLGSSLALWLDASDESTITLNGSTVSQWNDKSGNNRNAVQAVAASQPAYTPAGLNGKAVLTFDGSNDLFELSSGIPITDNFTYVYSVYGRATTGLNSVDVGRTTTPVGYGNWWFTDNVLYSLLRGTSFMVHGSSTATGTFINGLVRNNSGTQAYRNGTAFGGAVGAAATGDVTLNAIGRAQGGSAAVHNGPMAEIIVGRSDLSTADRQKLEGYLAWKWGLQSNLPVDHPYRSTPPSSERNRIGTDTVFTAELDEISLARWNPTELGSGLGLWLDAADAGTVSLNGSTVSQWLDKSGKNRHVAQSTPSKQPTYTTAGQNGNNVLTFNSAANQSLFATTSTINISQPFTRFIVGQFLTKSTMSVMIDSESTNDQCVFYNGETGSTSWVVANGFNPSFQSFSYGTSDFLNHLHFHSINGASSTWGIDGSTPVTAANSPGSRGQLGIRIGTIRTELSPLYTFNGRVFEVILIEGVISDTDRQRVEGYLAWKWGLQGSLPSEHPYKNVSISNASKKELSTGVLQVANEFDEFTGAPVVDNNLRVWVDAAQTASYSGSGSTWNNLSPATGSFTLFNGPAFDGNNAGGELTFLSASFQYADNATNLGNMPNFTVEAWAKVTASLTGQITAIICNQYNLSTALNFSIGTNNAPTDYNICVGFFDGAWRNTTGFNPTLNQWYHFVGTYDGSVLRYYINGSQNSFLNYSGTPSSGGTIRIARRWDSPDNVSTNFFPGEVGICRVYNRALTADEVLTNFNAHRNRYGV